MIVALMIIAGISLLGAIACLLAMLILDTLIKRNDKHLKEIDQLMWHNEHGTPIEEMLEMPMPRKLRKQMRKIHEEFERNKHG